MHSIFYSDKSPRCICGRHRWHLGPPNRCREESPTVPTQREPPVGLLHIVAVHGEEPSSSSAPPSTWSPSASPLLNMQHQLEAARHTPRCRRCGAPQPAPPQVFATPHRLLPHAPSSSPFLAVGEMHSRREDAYSYLSSLLQYILPHRYASTVGKVIS
jgi:hypothetical protein